MVSVEIHIPSRSRGGHRIHDYHHLTFLRSVVENVGPIERLQGLMFGVLRHGDGITVDPLTVVYLLRFSSLTDLGQLRRVVDMAKEHFAQDTIRVICPETVEEM